MTTTTTTIKQRRLVRMLAGAHKSMPVEVHEGDFKPVMKGVGFRWETKGGRSIYHPSSYRKLGWSNMVYHASTYRVEVGEKWLKKYT